jgi:hypothetical protein
MERVCKTDLKTYKKILVKTNAHLIGYRSGDTLNITRGKKFAMSLHHCLHTQRDANRRCGVGGKSIYGQTVLRLCQTVGVLDVAEAAASGREKEVCPGVLGQQGAYTMHRPARKRFPRNPYTVTNVWVCYLADLQAYARYNDNHRYIHRCILEISTSGPRKEKERPFNRLGVSVHTRRSETPADMGADRLGQGIFK